MPRGNTKPVSPLPLSVYALLSFVNIFPNFRSQTPFLSSHHQQKKKKMQIYFLLAAVFPTVIIGSPVADGPIGSLENFMSFLPQDLAPNPDHITYPDALQSQNSNDQTFEYFAIPDQQQTGPNFAFDMALAPSSQGEKVDDETAKYREFNCQESYSVCCQGSDPSRSSKHKSCSESKINSQDPPPPLFPTLVAKIICVTHPLESTNQYAGREDVGSKDMRYGQYCYNPFYTTACDDSLVTMLQVRTRESKIISLLSLHSLSFHFFFLFFFWDETCVCTCYNDWPN